MTVDENEIVWDDGDAERREVLKVARDRIAALPVIPVSEWDTAAQYYGGYGKAKDAALAIIDALIADPNS